MARTRPSNQTLPGTKGRTTARHTAKGKARTPAKVQKANPRGRARKETAPNPYPIIQAHENVEGVAEETKVNLFSRYKLKQDHKVYEDDDRGPWRITKNSDFVNNKRLSNDEYDTIVARAKEYFKKINSPKGFKFDMQWMVDYLCYNFIDDKYDDGTHVCHSCGCDDLEDEPDDQLFKCSGKGNDGKGCNRYSHHRYDCSKAGTHGPKLDVDSNKHPDLPADAKCEGMWCCWECMFNKGRDQAFDDEKNLTEAIDQYYVQRRIRQASQRV